MKLIAKEQRGFYVIKLRADDGEILFKLITKDSYFAENTTRTVCCMWTENYERITRINRTDLDL